MRLAITGASGFIGTHLRARFPDHVVILRDDPVEMIRDKLQGVDVVVNLAGAPIIRRWTKAYKKVLEDSRIQTTRRLVAALKGLKGERHLISTSAIGIYPDGVACDEDCTTFSRDFLGELAQKWEHEALCAPIPTTILRLGVILGQEGGALKLMLLPFKLGLGGPIGRGNMVMSWLAIDDLMEIYQFVIKRSITGIVNAVSPNPVTNLEFTKVLGRVLRRPTIFPIPPFVLWLLYGEAYKVLTGSKEVYPKVLLENGFSFKYPEVKGALEHILIQ